MTQTWGDELARLRREVVEMLENAETEGRFTAWAIRQQALAMWRQLDAAEAYMNRKRDQFVEAWLDNGRWSDTDQP
jgi:hypothetical protein